MSGLMRTLPREAARGEALPPVPAITLETATSPRSIRRRAPLHSYALLMTLKMASRLSAEVLSSVAEHKEAVMCVRKKIRALNLGRALQRRWLRGPW